MHLAMKYDNFSDTAEKFHYFIEKLAPEDEFGRDPRMRGKRIRQSKFAPTQLDESDFLNLMFAA